MRGESFERRREGTAARKPAGLVKPMAAAFVQRASGVRRPSQRAGGFFTTTQFSARAALSYSSISWATSSAAGSVRTIAAP
jgi:hypothetical protein